MNVLKHLNNLDRSLNSEISIHASPIILVLKVIVQLSMPAAIVTWIYQPSTSKNQLTLISD